MKYACGQNFLQKKSFENTIAEPKLLDAQPMSAMNPHSAIFCDLAVPWKFFYELIAMLSRLSGAMETYL